MAAAWKVRRGDEEVTLGGLTELQAMVAEGSINSADIVFHPRLERWMALRQVPEVTLPVVKGSTISGARPRPSQQPSRKSSAAIAAVAVLIAVGVGAAAILAPRQSQSPVSVTRQTAIESATTAPPAAVEPSPAVKALLVPDPDVETTLSADEVKATLAAAQGPSQVDPPTQAPAGPPPNTGSTWADLESAQAEKKAEWERKLDATIIYVSGNGDTYHIAGCQALYRTDIRRDGRQSRVYFGSARTLKAAYTAKLAPHSCGPPSYEQTYR